MPLHMLIGGGPALSLTGKYAIGMVDPIEAREAIGRGRQLGFSYFKLKVGGELQEDLARVAAAAESLAPGERVGVDANGGWSHATALTALEPLQDMNISFLEQPVSSRFAGALADVASRSRIPILAHESVFRMQDALMVAACNAAHIWVLSPTNSGGALSMLDLLAVARAHSIPCLISGGSDLGVETALLLQLGAAFDEIASCPVPSDIVGPLWNEGDVIREPFCFEGDRITAPSRPGLGVELDPERVAAYRVSGA